MCYQMTVDVELSQCQNEKQHGRGSRARVYIPVRV